MKNMTRGCCLRQWPRFVLLLKYNWVKVFKFMYVPDWKIEKKMLAGGWDFVIGVDEAGRGPLAGPVVAGAVVLKNEALLKAEKSDKTKKKNDDKDVAYELIRDSKTLSEKQRDKVFGLIKENFYVGVGICNEKTIDRINILEASFLAMKMAIAELKKQLQGKSRIAILVDGNKIIPNFSEKQEAVPQGDKKVKSIAAASIIAKVTRDEMMKKYAEKYPVYDFHRHKGYGTKAHMEALRKFGPCEIHRKSFTPVKNNLLRSSR